DTESDRYKAGKTSLRRLGRDHDLVLPAGRHGRFVRGLFRRRCRLLPNFRTGSRKGHTWGFCLSCGKAIGRIAFVPAALQSREKSRISDSRSPGRRLGKSDRKSLWIPGGKNHTLCDPKRAGCLGWARKRKAEENGFGAS